jgi:hypothetical protein
LPRISKIKSKRFSIPAFSVISRFFIIIILSPLNSHSHEDKHSEDNENGGKPFLPHIESSQGWGEPWLSEDKRGGGSEIIVG